MYIKSVVLGFNHAGLFFQNWNVLFPSAATPLISRPLFTLLNLPEKGRRQDSDS